MLNKILLIVTLFIFCSATFSQSSYAVKLPKQNQVKEGEAKMLSFSFYKDGKLPIPFHTFIPSNAVEGLISFSDYATNGNTLNQIIARNDTIIVAQIYVDSAEAQNANGGNTVRMTYNYSFNGGSSWESTARLELSLTKSRWPDLFYLNTVVGPTVGGSGRVWTIPSLRAGGVAIDALLGAATGTIYFVPGTGQSGNTDYFTDKMTNGKLAGLWQRADTIYSQTFDPVATTYGNRVFLYRTANTNTVASYDVYASNTGNTISAFYNFINEDPTTGGENYAIFRHQKSTDEGTTWTTPVKILENYMIDGDSAQAYWHQDASYKPGTQNPYLVFSSQPPSLFGNFNPGGTLLDSNRRGYNILIWSPNLNGGTPVRVASYLNMDILADTNKFKLATRIRTIQGVSVFAAQVNSSIVGHPSIGFSPDGSVIHIAFSAYQVDTSSEGFNFNDIFTTKSTDGGLTWSTPENITNTPNEDEMYPVVSKTGNSTTGARITYQSTTVPGCQGFGRSSTIESQIIAPVYQCFRSTIIGIINISSEVPGSYSLMQNFPNPFNPSTKIRFSVPKTGNITIEVFDISGKLVQTLANNESVTPGIKEVSFNASNYSSGVYFYKLTAGDFSETKKMILIK